VTRRVCRELARLHSAYLDGALDHRDRERIAGHLLGCAACRADVDELRSLRRLLHRMGDPGEDTPASQELSARLVSIAGRDADLPVWSRPFRRTPAGVLPSVRRALRLRVTAAVLALGGVAAASGVAGYVAAPAQDLAVLADPTDRVRSEFASTLSELPLLSRSVNALMMSSDAGQQTEAARVSVPAPQVSGMPVAVPTAVAALRRAASRGQQVHYVGTQKVRAAVGDQTVSASVQLRSEPGQGSLVTVLRTDGGQGPTRFMPSAPTARLDDQLLSVLLSNFQISGWRGQRVVGRPVTVVEATTRSPGVERAAARWWVDDATGLLLRHESYDDAGAVSLATEFTEVTIRTKATFMEHLAPRLAMSTTPASVADAQAAELASSGWSCSSELADLTLVRMRSDEAPVPTALSLLYTDGVATLSVFQQRGILAAAPRGSQWDESLQAYVHSGVPSMATWASGDTVFTVVSDSSLDLVRRAATSLPHEASAPATTMERVQAGWARIRELVTG
jgi:hypothetical protein